MTTHLKSISSFFMVAAMTLTMCAATGSQALAHETIIKPAKTQVAKGESVTIQILAAHVFMVSEEAEDPKAVELSLKQGDKSLPVPLKENAAALCLEGVFTLPEDGPATLIGHLKPEYLSQTTEGLLDGSRQELEALGKTVLYTTENENFAKTLLNVQKSNKDFFNPVGQELEIVPLDDISKLKAGDEQRFAVMRKGELVYAPILATYDGFSLEKSTYAYYTEGGDDNIAKVKFSAPGLWMLRTELKDKSTNKDVRERVLRAVLVFEVQSAVSEKP